MNHKTVIPRTWEEENHLLSKEVRQYFQGSDPVRILEAGCGRQWELDLNGLEFRLTGLDIDKNALKARIDIENDLDEVILGDLRSIPLPKDHYHLVYNAFVLEHVEGAEKVLKNLFQSLKPNGILILRIPDRYSIFGFCTRLVPYKLLVFYFRYLLKLPEAGKPGHYPYPVVHEKIVSKEGIYDYCRNHRHRIIAEYASNLYLEHFGRLAFLVKIFARTMWIISWGKLTANHNNLTFVIKKGC